MMRISAIILVVVAGAHAQSAPQIVREGNNVILQAAPGGDVAFRTNSGPNGAIQTQTLSSLVARITALENTSRIASLEARVASLESNTMPSNITTITYTSNMNIGTPRNDISFLVGRFSVSQSLDITVEDQGPCSSFSMRFTIVAQVNPGAFQPQIFSAGAADGRRNSLVQWYFAPNGAASYYLWLYLPPWPLCGLGGVNAGTHTLIVSTQASSRPNLMSFVPPNPPVFDWFQSNISGIARIITQIYAIEGDITPMINQQLNRAQIVQRWTSNMNTTYAASNGVSNDLRLLVGKFSVSSVVTVSVSDDGSCSSLAQDFTVLSRWGVHLASSAPANNPDLYHPEVFTFGVASEWNVHTNLFNWYFKANGTNMYFLYLYIPPLPICGTSGLAPIWHTATVTVQSSSPISQTWVNPATPTLNSPVGTVLGAPAFDFPEAGNASGIYSINTQVAETDLALTPAINAALERVVYNFRWFSNMDPTWASQNNQPNYFAAYLGRVSVNSVVTLAISDDGYCSGTAIEYKLFGTWGLQNTNTSGAAGLVNSFAPVAYALGQAAGMLGGRTASQILQVFYSPIPTGTAGSIAHMYNLFVYVPAFGVCGSRGPNGLGTVPQPHNTVVTMRVDGRTDQVILNGTIVDNDGNSVPFDWLTTNNTNILPMNTQVIDPIGSDLFRSAISQSINRNTQTFSYMSNYDNAVTIASRGNGSTLVGLFSTSQAIDITVQDDGWCSGIGMTFTLLGKWGAANVPTQPNSEDNHPEIFTFGSSAEWQFNPATPDTNIFQFYFTAYRNPITGAAAQDRYYLWLYIPPFTICGSPAPQLHTTTVTVVVSKTPSSGLTFANMFSPVNPPPFNYFSGNSSNITRIRAQVIGTM